LRLNLTKHGNSHQAWTPEPQSSPVHYTQCNALELPDALKVPDALDLRNAVELCNATEKSKCVDFWGSMWQS